MNARHPATWTWAFPPEREVDPARLNLREWASAHDRFEHQLVVVARAGGAQLECPTASEPLYFAHAAGSDEYALALPTGDPLLDLFQARTFLSDPATGADVARYRHGCGDLVLHPHGLLHWPGRLRPPYEPFRFGAGMRRRGLSLVACASSPCAPGARPLCMTPGREGDAKRDREAVPLSLVDTRRAAPGVIARIAGAAIELLVDPVRVAPPTGAYLFVLDSERVDLFPCDLVHVAPGSTREVEGVRRALLFSSPGSPVDAPPPSWTRVAPPPFAPFEHAPPGVLPLAIGDLRLDPAGEARVRVSIGSSAAEVPSYWLARHLFRVALHGFTLGYTETYEGFFVEERADELLVGLRGGEPLPIPRDRALETIEALYRACAPPGYVEQV